ncbi:hypothetical protein PR202_gb05110 [Eleusine coracana subsp. coracana]|uniref:Uncharacterized protein n=1 Tax=Eleusine coracana subsp. coracana TaxID=191504 RepID=A0AAV5E3P7_ELECO|nr:hypothetical protein PR202_gb05110 [Eleusine coracana subsp. coracana]
MRTVIQALDAFPALLPPAQLEFALNKYPNLRIPLSSFVSQRNMQSILPSQCMCQFAILCFLISFMTYVIISLFTADLSCKFWASLMNHRRHQCRLCLLYYKQQMQPPLFLVQLSYEIARVKIVVSDVSSMTGVAAATPQDVDRSCRDDCLE